MTNVSKLLCLGVMMVSAVARSGTGETPGQVLDSFHQAAARADAGAYFATMTEEVVFLGTDGSERWQGQAFRDFVRSNFDSGRGWTYRPVARNIELSADRGFAWFDESLHNEHLGQCRGSGVLLRTATGWKIAQYNLSVPVPNVLVEQLVADIAALEAAPPAVPADKQSAQVEGTAQAQDTATTPDTEAQVVSDGNCRKKRFKTNRRAGC